MVSKEGAQPPPPPNCLGDAGVATWRSLTKAFQFHNGELVILEQLCKTQDEIADMEESLDEFGPMILGSRGQRVLNPVYGQIAAHRSLLDRLMLSLALPFDGEQVGRRRSPQAKAAVNTRWKTQARRGRLPTVGA